MASLQENYDFWNHRYNWSEDRGDQWSANWGGPKVQWDWCVYPRIRQHLPTQRILEIGPGQGRWTQFLRQHCEELIVVDISEKCIDMCRDRFGDLGMTYHVGDGQSLSFLQDRSIDFVFSFESLIHTEIDALSHYLKDLSAKLKQDAVGFLHHSNLGAYQTYFKRAARLPKALRKFWCSKGLLDSDEWRARTVTHQNFAQAASSFGMSIQSQELVPWGGRRLIDCFSTFRAGDWAPENKIVENPDFIKRAHEIRRLSRLYGSKNS